mgnify:CR=1 FL=1
MKKGDPLVVDLRQVRYSANGNIQYTLDYSDEWELVPARKPYFKSCEDVPNNIPLLYKSQLKIMKSKYDHLQQLKEVLEPDCYSFYDTLPY